MRRPNHSSTWKTTTTCLAGIALFLLAVTPLLATGSDVKADPSDAEEAPEMAEELDTGVCADPDAAETLGVNTLEDIYSISRGNLAALLTTGHPPASEEAPAVEEVRWTEVDKSKAKAGPAPEKDKD